MEIPLDAMDTGAASLKPAQSAALEMLKEISYGSVSQGAVQSVESLLIGPLSF